MRECGAAWVSCWLGSATGYFVIGGPLSMLIFWRGVDRSHYKPKAMGIEFAIYLTALFLAVLLSADLPFFDPDGQRGVSVASFMFLPLPILQVMIMRFGVLGASVGIIFSSITYVFALSSGYSEAWGAQPSSQIHFIQSYLCIVSLVTMSMAIYLETIRRQKAALEALNHGLVQARREAEAGRAAKKNFLCMMHHELRTPLNAILGFSELIKEQAFGPLSTRAYEGFGHNIHSSGQRLLSMIEGLLRTAESDASIFDLEKRHIDLRLVIEESLKPYREQARARDIALACQANSNAVIETDPCALNQMISALVGNALAHTPAGGLVRVTYFRVGADTVIEVCDNGVGFDVERWQASASKLGRPPAALEHGKGLGIGLVMTQVLALAMGGRLALSSAPGKGTCARIILYATHAMSLDQPAVA